MPAAAHDYTDLDPDGLREHLAAEHGADSGSDHASNVALHRADHAVAAQRRASLYEHVRVSTDMGLSRCPVCRCLVMPSQMDQRGHDDWHASNGAPASTGW